MFRQSFSHVGFGSLWGNLISASDDCDNARGMSASAGMNEGSP